MGRAALWGLGAAIGIAALFAALVGILDIGVGLIAPAVIGGWAIAAATRAGASSSASTLPSPWVRVLAIAFALSAWLAGYFGAYLISLLLRPDSSLTFAERVAQSPFLDWLSPQFGPLQVVELMLLGGIAWYGSRSGTRQADA